MRDVSQMSHPADKQSPADTFYKLFAPQTSTVRFAFLLSASLSPDERVSRTVRSDTDTAHRVTE